MADWKDLTWGDVATLEYGKALRGYESVSGPYRVFGTNGPIGWHTEPIYKEPSVIIGRKGAYRGVRYAREAFFVIDTAFYLKPKMKLDMRWAYYELLTHDINNMDSGSAIPSTSRSDFYSLPLSLPPLKEQHAIASVLGALDDTIDLNRRMNETLELMARAIFKDWFVDFGPVRAKAEGRQPPGLAPGISTLFPDAIDDDDKPVGWEFTSLSTLATLNPESWSKSTAPAKIDYVDLANTKWGTIESTQKYARSDAPSRAQRVLRTGDTIVGTVRPGNGSYSYVTTDGLTGSTGFAVLRPKELEFREYVYLASTAPENVERLTHLADGAAYPAVRPDVVAATEIVNLDKRLISRFSATVGPLLSQIELNKRQNQTLAQLRDLLLPKLISGELLVAEAEKAIQAVA